MMQIIYLINKKKLFMAVFLIGLLVTTDTYAYRLGDGPVIVEVKNNNVCFSVSKYKPRGYFFKNFSIGSEGFAVHNLGVAEFQKGVVWEQRLLFGNEGSEFILKPNQCVSYGTLLSNYNLHGNVQSLYSGKYSVIISGYDPAADKKAIFMSVFSIDVTNGNVTLK